MSNIFSNKKFVKVNIGNIIWEDSHDQDLPSNIQEYEVEIDEDIDPSEKWCEDGYQTGYDTLCETLTHQLSYEYGFYIIDIENVEVID